MIGRRVCSELIRREYEETREEERKRKNTNPLVHQTIGLLGKEIFRRENF
jgi:hypothetical protein